MRTESTRNCCPSSRLRSASVIVGHSTAAVSRRRRAVTLRAWPTSQTARALGARRQRVDRLALARDARDGRARAADRGRRRRRRHVEPDDLREGPLDRATGTTSSFARRSSDATIRRRSSSTLAVEDVQARVRSPAARPGTGPSGVDGYVSIEVDPGLAYDRDATFEEAMRLHELVDRPNVYVKIPGTEPGLGAIEDCIAAGRSINVTLIFSLERHARGCRGVRPRARAARRCRRRSRRTSPRSRASSSPASTPRPTAASRSSAARTSRGGLRSRTRSSRTSTTSRSFSGDRAGTRSPRRARSRSAACGPRPRRRTRPTATSSTSRSSSAPTR